MDGPILASPADASSLLLASGRTVTSNVRNGSKADLPGWVWNGWKADIRLMPGMGGKRTSGGGKVQPAIARL